jgi:hypothetical protein
MLRFFFFVNFSAIMILLLLGSSYSTGRVKHGPSVSGNDTPSTSNTTISEVKCPALKPITHNNTSISPHAFVAWRSVKRRDNFTLHKS